jgi:hypothetical protein
MVLAPRLASGAIKSCSTPALFTSGPGDTTVQLIRFLEIGGTSLYDHNRIPNPLGNSVLDTADNWTIGDDAVTCPGTTPAGRLTATFADGSIRERSSRVRRSSGDVGRSAMLRIDERLHRRPRLGQRLRSERRLYEPLTPAASASHDAAIFGTCGRLRGPSGA